MQKKDVVAGCNLGGSGTDPAAYMGLIQNLLSQETEALHLLLINQHFLLPALTKKGPLKMSEPYLNVASNSFFNLLQDSSFDSHVTEITCPDLKCVIVRATKTALNTMHNYADVYNSANMSLCIASVHVTLTFISWS